MLRAKLISDYLKGETKILSCGALMGAQTPKNFKKFEKKIFDSKGPPFGFNQFCPGIISFARK